MVDHFIKDLGIAVRETEMMGIKLPGLELAKSLYEKVSNMGHGSSGTQALLLALQDIGAWRVKTGINNESGFSEYHAGIYMAEYLCHRQTA